MLDFRKKWSTACWIFCIALLKKSNDGEAFSFQSTVQGLSQTSSSSHTVLHAQKDYGDRSILEELVDETIASNRKLVIITGGVVSGIGKGVTASSLGVLFRGMGLRVTALKIDPYLNVDAGTMSPIEHGEVFVLDDGGECDLDLGNYERFLSVFLTQASNLSTGKIYQQVIERERVGEYLGKTVQVVPHVSDAIQEWVLKVAKEPVAQSKETEDGNLPPEICIVELGGTLGDIESMPFVEALRQLQENVGYKNMCFLHVSLVPEINGEQKTKPTQHSVKTMMQLGLRPDFLCVRGASPIEDGARDKLSIMTSVPKSAIISLYDVSNLYRVPLVMMEQNIPSMLAQRLRLPKFAPPRGVAYHEFEGEVCNIDDSKVIQNWKKLADAVDAPESECSIAICGKYIEQGDAYLSVIKALTHAAIATKQKLNIEFVDSSELEQGNEAAQSRFAACDGLVVPGGFGSRGFEGKVMAVRSARENKMPFLGICLGMQAAVIEFARSHAGISSAHSAEFKDDLKADEEDIIIFMPEGDRTRMGGTMRLGARETTLREGSIARELYGSENIMERHRHRYEVNPALVERLEALGLHFSGKNTDKSGERMEVIELDKSDHPYFVAAQFHPEFTSRPEKPNPLFLGLLQQIKKQKEESK
mmetsp:Transcript_17184/g.37595  ORF Transcript_17184/g.37595 Transcript_17184/m.37595 type:complete len:646 (-) Transcript_17184:118-2055(-)|eukprot:CAMPEP_0168184592 /NCGR_PEP_ID=MMETSP0139_2-20121125/13330_1 /TAXON_ID=44445 /ORGANISM="Pseudo-nitzschia australis, Strain 10249 10 AB" /LENGTH=645 /DNA_ID=CAMNT_0008106241 /DNA_START=44 /DNA_END=1981 /DNA_ORIENTATION=+